MPILHSIEYHRHPALLVSSMKMPNLGPGHASHHASLCVSREPLKKKHLRLYHAPANSVLVHLD